MVFIHDTTLTLAMVVDLVNTVPGFHSDDRLRTVSDLDDFLQRYPYPRAQHRRDVEVAALREVRARLSVLWDLTRDDAVDTVNAMLADGHALPRLVRHEDLDWHIHATEDDAPIATRVLVEAAMAFVDVIRADEFGRIRRCEADDCDGAYVDQSKNGSKRYCDTGNCGNRMNVIAYRKRKAEETT